MKTFACGDVVPGCARTFTDATDEGILEAVAAHAAAHHGLTEVPPQLLGSVRAAIRPA